MRLLPAVLSVILAVTIGACAGNRPRPEKGATTDGGGIVGLENARFLTGAQPFANVPRSGRFDFVVPFEIVDDPRVDAERVERRIRLGVTRALNRKGYEHGGVDPAFLVKVRLVVDEAVDAFAPVRREGRDSEWIRPVAGDVDDESFEKGALLLDILDPVDRWSVWRGVCGANVMIDVSEEKGDERIEKIVERLLEGFPPP